MPVADVAHLGDLLALLEERRAVLVSDSRDSSTIVGLLTISDLNRHAVRKALYDIVSVVESRLATLLEHMLEDEERAIRRLDQYDQISLLGHFHFMKEHDVQLSMLGGATLRSGARP